MSAPAATTTAVREGRTLAVVIEPAELVDLARTESIALVEVGREPSATPTIPGALRLTLDDLSGPERADSGNRPLPDHAELAHRLRHGGIGARTRVIVVAETPRDLAGAARAWVVLRWAGIRRVSYLNGVHAAEVAELGLPDRRDQTGVQGDHDHDHDHDHDLVIDAAVVAEAAEIAARHPDVLLVDARTPEGFGDEGQHIAGAVNVPSGRLAADGRVHDAATIHAAYRDAIGVDPASRPVIVYCGSGVSASVQALALASIDVIAPVYVGSFSEWSKHTP
ncbi:sulfurtransferase [Agromyces sp. MMS24-K17]|uniref:sulfurtransferase n=1 Tax=Agromyces sp. MMS24-K17 TaxID=3372850 RepID=UPI003754733D